MSEQLNHEKETVEEWHEALKQAVADRGADYTYQSEYDSYLTCSYVVDGNPACIIGQAYYNLYGENVPDYLEGASASQMTYNTRLSEALKEAQIVQDRGDTWGDALRKFESMLGIEEES